MNGHCADTIAPSFPLHHQPLPNFLDAIWPKIKLNKRTDGIKRDFSPRSPNPSTLPVHNKRHLSTGVFLFYCQICLKAVDSCSSLAPSHTHAGVRLLFVFPHLASADTAGIRDLWPPSAWLALESRVVSNLTADTSETAVQTGRTS